jgi:hypothetical protein
MPTQTTMIGNQDAFYFRTEVDENDMVRVVLG